MWRGERELPTNWPTWATTAIDTLQHNAQVDGDNTLVALVRLSSLFSDASKAVNEKDPQTMQNSRLILAGLEQQNRELQHSMNHMIRGFGKLSWVSSTRGKDTNTANRSDTDAGNVSRYIP